MDTIYNTLLLGTKVSGNNTWCAFWYGLCDNCKLPVWTLYIVNRKWMKATF